MLGFTKRVPPTLNKEVGGDSASSNMVDAEAKVIHAGDRAGNFTQNASLRNGICRDSIIITSENKLIIIDVAEIRYGDEPKSKNTLHIEDSLNVQENKS